MYSAFALANKYLLYYLRSSNGRGHGIHSPFVYDFVRNVLMDKRTFYDFDAIEQCAAEMLTDQRLIQVADLGSGMHMEKTSLHRVADLAKLLFRPKKYNQLIFRIVNYYGAQHLLEIGTSLGIRTAYMASANRNASIFSLERAEELAKIASKNFNSLQLSHIEIVQGNFDEILSNVILKMKQIDLVFVNGNHRREPTLRYFEQLLPAIHEGSIMIFDDIHQSEEMELAWIEIQKHPDATLTIDLFFIGLVFFRKEQKCKQHFSIRY
ncbi:MAG: class I SAM-dependent methyltransferase [Chitinophagaceae bacterium]|nr:class I SAM-dependent methyltransferase [Chitinophagaceae bacterium]